MKSPFIDLFAGCGGLSLGLEQAGFNPVYVNELNNDALSTYLVYLFFCLDLAVYSLDKDKFVHKLGF